MFFDVFCKEHDGLFVVGHQQKVVFVVFVGKMISKPWDLGIITRLSNPLVNPTVGQDMPPDSARLTWPVSFFMIIAGKTHPQQTDDYPLVN